MSMAQSMNALIEKTSTYDKDERYMATNDLCTELQRDTKLDGTLERRICAAVMKQLDDPSNDVQSIAVKTLGVLVKKVAEQQVSEIADKLCSLVLEGKKELRDIYSIGLKTLISDMPMETGHTLAGRISTRLIAGIKSTGEIEIPLECLDNFGDLLLRFGHDLATDHPVALEALLALVMHEKPLVRKRAIACLGAIAQVLNDTLLNQLVEQLLQRIAAARADGGDSSAAHVLILTVGTISRTVGYRLGRHLDVVVPLFLQFTGDADGGDGGDSDNEDATEAENALRENVFHALESFVLRCPRKVTSHVPALLDAALAFMKYDPNYSYGDDDDDEELDDAFDDDDFSDCGDMDSDDDDISWKVRRASLKVLAAIVSSRSDLVDEMLARVAPQLIDRLKERESNVRLDVVACLTKLLGSLPPTNAPSAALTAVIDASVAVAQKQFALPAAKADDKTRVLLFGMLSKLCGAVPGGLAKHAPALVASVLACLDTRTSQQLRLEALCFLRKVMECHAPEVFQPHLAAIIPLVVVLVDDDWYKLIAEALRVIGTIVAVMRPLDQESGMFLGNYDYSAHVVPLYDAIHPRLEEHDIDQEIKECAIATVGTLVATAGDDLADDVPEVLALLLDRMSNEITRVHVLKALTLLANSSLTLDLSSVLDDAVRQLADFLKQQNRPLKQTALETLSALVSSDGKSMKPALLQLVLGETAPLVSSSDLHLAHLALQVDIGIVHASKAKGIAKAIETALLAPLLELAASPLLQGAALSSLLTFLQELLGLKAPALSFKHLLAALSALIVDGVPRQSVNNVARAIAALLATATDKERSAALNDLVAGLQAAGAAADGAAGGGRSQQLALRTVGELGQKRDLSSVAQLQSLILATFELEGSTEETKSAAAFALGRVAVGNMNAYLPHILSALAGDSAGHEYLLLSALKESISAHATTVGLDFSAHAPSVAASLLAHASADEEGVRNMVAECLGALLAMQPGVVLPTLATLASDANCNTRWTVASALRYSMSALSTGEAAASGASLAQLAPLVAGFLGLLKDDELGVQRAALLMVNAAAHHQASLLAPVLDAVVLPALYEKVQLKLERVVDLGPFKHKVDDGLPLRKVALSCVNTLLDTLPTRVNVADFMPHLAAGLADKDEVALLSHQMLVKICEKFPGAAVGSLEPLLEPLEKSANKKIKESQVGTEVERANDLIRSALRAVLALEAVPDACAMCRPLVDCLARLRSKDRLNGMMKQLRASG